MQKRFDSIISGLFPEKGTVLLAVSGGTDSMALVNLFLHSSAAPFFAVAHCNFHLRGSESDEDAEFVRQWCRKYGIRFFREDFDTEKEAAEAGESIEMAARRLRYSYFDTLCKGLGLDALCVAHNASDNAETLILNLLRGTGIKGLAGMKEVSEIPVPGSHIPLVRPLLRFTREELSEYLSSLGEGFREDSTNASTQYRRNRIRNLVFPVFREINPSFLEAIGRDMDNLRQVSEIADRYYIEAASSLTKVTTRGTEISIEALKHCKSWQYLLYRLLEPYSLSTSALSDMERLLQDDAQRSGQSFISGGKRILLTAKEIIITNNPIPTPSDETLAVRGDGLYEIGAQRFSVETIDMTPQTDLRMPQGSIIFDAGTMPFPFLVRHFRNGDWMVPLGMKGRKKLSDIFTDLKFSAVDKESALVAVSPSLSGDDGSRIHVAALLGHRIDNSIRVTDSTAKAVIIRLHRDGDALQ